MMFKQQILDLLELANDCDERGQSVVARKLDYVVAQLTDEEERKDEDFKGVLEGLDAANEVAERDKEEKDTEEEPEGEIDLEPELEPKPEPKPSLQTQKVNPDEEMNRTLEKEFSEYMQFIRRTLSNFQYLGQENVEVIQQAIEDVEDLFGRTLRKTTKHHFQNTFQRFRRRLEKNRKLLEKSCTKPLTRARAQYDDFLLFGPLRLLHRAMERQFETKDDESFGQLLYRMDALKEVIKNVWNALPKNLSIDDVARMG